jgi:hypothetical protein
MPEEPIKRRSDRVAMAISIRVSGLDEVGSKFDVEARTVNLSRHGATIVLKQPLQAHQEVVLRHPRVSKEAAFRVVGRIGGESEGHVYGVAQLDPAADLWGIGFPPVADGKRVVGRLLMECTVCAGQEVAYLNELEVQVFQANQALTRPCAPCAQPTLWKGVGSSGPGQPAQAGTADSSAEAAQPQPSTVGNRRNTRVKASLAACIRQAGFSDEIVATVNVSRGGLCFLSPKAYVIGSPIEISVPYSKSGANIFVTGRVAHTHKKPGENLYRVGVSYVQSVDDFMRYH